MILDSFVNEYRRYKSLAEKAISQVDDAALHRALGFEGNSIAVTMNHISGNLRSRFTNFLTEDGEKSWRDRESEFEERMESRADLLEKWNRAWEVLFAVLGDIRDSDLGRCVTIRGEELSIADALHRSLAHTAYHVGEVVLLARVGAGETWKSLSIPRGQSEEFNRKMLREHPPRPPG